MSHQRLQQGFTFIELIMSIVIIGVAVAGVLLVMTNTVWRSADPMITQQAVAVAEAYMEEVLTKEYSDPDGAVVVEARTLMDDVDDYDSFDAAPESPPRNQNDTAVLDNDYTVRVQVGNPGNVGPVGATTTMKTITVTVSHSSGISVTLVSHRADYP